ncbi:LEAF RUST 10 DISEASE-RESISTANCE LOCUS RECEPTOR-LIKE PROTEIN KINASE-like 2.1 isoform X2 [Carya illinoinensis]|uniref:LEAF RUST 10 DISEASE-RESISTANCE LOCUS RECEPTOR-LIKE PROTEIN KINASE-like 2.1 isoform X2 n=1 Tax=Carya illinoinensis TaxID=32201 RepID=UPI001C7204A2|nr:LEAF RUST 10 DISEASE-RESISTANCE LOCUS RECEPTOR-LIKE PROTEIN KINASE-like 2.1 isoform X2 [Carya illinoinensis]
MDAPYLSTSLPSILLISLFIILTTLLLPPSYCIGDDRFEECGRPYHCGSFENISFPYWIDDDRPDYCGHGVNGYKLECVNNEYPVLQFEGLEFRVMNFDQSTKNMTIARTDLWGNLCPDKKLDTTLNYTLYDYTSNLKNLTLFYGCPQNVSIPSGNRFECSPGAWNNAYFVDDTLLPHGINLSEFNGQLCDATVKVPVFKTIAFNEVPVVGAATFLMKILEKGFEVEYDESLLVACSGCRSSGGICSSSSTSTPPFVCFCRDGVQSTPLLCSDGRKASKSKVMIIAFASLSIVIGVLIIGLCFKRKFTSINIIHFFEKENLTHQSVETFLRNNGPFSIRRYSYSDIKKMTNFFRDQLGQGGYGCVYKGKLQDGSFVAVKVLKESKGDGEEFINEVTSISRTSHVNIVTLRGFCFEGSKRALIYEFMPNGSLEKFIYRKAPPKVDHHQLGWETLYMIAVGIARGLEYLHRGCNTRILHFDIKPHNILLDAKFCPKISDFGLAKICPRENSIISLLGARGTVGYIAPEVFCRNFGGISHKSDVYSYGMMVLEMVGGTNNIDVETDHTSETYFPHWIYRHLELDKELWMQGIVNEEDKQNIKKMLIVGLCCIQTDPSNRPTMSRVVDMLEGSLDSLQIPPKPFLSSPSRPLGDSSSTMTLHYDSIIP